METATFVIIDLSANKINHIFTILKDNFSRIKLININEVEIMRYRVIGEGLPVVILNLDRGETIITESGGMSWMSDGIDMSTNMEGGLFKGLARAFGGESVFLTRYTSKRDNTEIAFSSSFPGKIVPLNLSPGQSIICQKHAFLCGESSINLDVIFNKRLGAGFFGGEGFILQKITGPGICFLEIDGEAVEYNLAPGEILKVDTGHVAAFEPSVSYDIVTVKGFKNVFFGGEGLFLTELRGPGKVILQSLPIQNLAREIIPYIPVKHND